MLRTTNQILDVPPFGVPHPGVPTPDPAPPTPDPGRPDPIPTAPPPADPPTIRALHGEMHRGTRSTG
jgi:hypothetical protein